jgi:prepilin signal peptidase PulO-like enzyme (type II secretory pathway)
MLIEISKLIFFFFLGACFGSFVSMASYRLPKKIGIIFSRSFCPRCQTTLQWIALIPIFSYIFSKGKCIYCNAKISSRYIITELVTATLFLFIYLKFGLTYNAVLLMMLATSLMIIIITDLENYIISDSIQIFMLIIALVYIFSNNLNFVYYIFSSLIYAGLGIVLYYSFLFITKKEAIGMGDIKFMGISGLFLGIHMIGIYLFIAGVTGTIFGLFWTKIKKVSIFPFGPALAISLFLCLMFLNDIESILFLGI